MVTPNRYRTWIDVDLKAIIHNYGEAVKLLKPGCTAMAIVKADSYGLGAVPIAEALEKAGCEYFGVACMDEALELREGGIRSRLMTLSPVPYEMLEQAINDRIEFPVTGLQQAKVYSDLAIAMDKRPIVHVKVDVGLSRIGIVLNNRLDEAKREILEIFALPGLEVVAAMGHITGSEAIGGDEFNRAQLSLYEKLTVSLEKEGLTFEKHILSSGPFIRYPAYAYDHVRLGALLYGSLPGLKLPFELKPVVGMHTRVIQIKKVPAGTPISYGPVFHTLRETIIATVCVGFSDGIRRSIVNGGSMLVGGRRAPLIGKLCSDYAMLDVTDIPNVHENDIVTLFGNNGDISQGIENYAALYPASVSETTAAFAKRIPRFYINADEA